MIKKIFYFFRDFKLQIILITLYVSIFDGLGQIVPAFILKFLFDEGILKKNLRLFILLGILYFISGALVYIVGLHVTLVMQKLKNKVASSYILNMLMKYYSIPYDVILKHNKNYFFSRIYEETKNATFSSVDALIGTFAVLFRFSFSFAAVLYLSPRITFIGLLITPFAYILSKKLSSRISDYSKNEAEKEAHFRNSLLRAISSYKEVKMFNITQNTETLISKKLQEFLTFLYKRIKYSVLYQKSGEIIMGLFQTLIIILAGFEVYAGRMSFGSFLAFIRIFINAVSSFIGVFDIIPNLIKNVALIDRVTEYFKLVNSNEKYYIVSENIKLKNIYFSYNQKIIFKNFNLDIPRLSKSLITGSNGSGKTTLAYILCGLLKVEKGEVCIIEPNKISASLEPVYFPEGKVKEFVLQNYTHKFQELIKDFRLLKVIEKDFQELSSGEKKKFSVLMTLLKPAELYIFDEPLANVDVESKDIIMQRIFEYTKDKTLIVIMHGEEKYHKYFDRIINLDELKKEGFKK